MSNHPGEDAASDTSAKPSCTICDAGYHRYGTTDPEHEHSYTACINQLRGRIEDYVRAHRGTNDRWSLDEETAAFVKLAEIVDD